MSWAKMDDSFPFHPKTIAAGNASAGAWCRMLTWCSQQLTDGMLPARLALIISDGDTTIIERLVKVGLLEERPAGYAIHDYLWYNPSRATVLAERAKWKARQDKARGIKRDEPRDNSRDTTSDEPRDTQRDNSRDTTRESRGPAPVPFPGVPSEHLPRGKPREKPVRQKHAWYADARFKALAELWPENRRGNKADAFACWEGQGEDGKVRIEAKVRQTVADCPAIKLGAFSELVLDAAHAPYTPSAIVTTEPCDYCGVKFSTDNGVLTLHVRACAAALKAKAMVRQ